jgi:hypothetical protein
MYVRCSVLCEVQIKVGIGFRAGVCTIGAKYVKRKSHGVLRAELYHGPGAYDNPFYNSWGPVCPPLVKAEKVSRLLEKRTRPLLVDQLYLALSC